MVKATFANTCPRHVTNKRVDQRTYSFPPLSALEYFLWRLVIKVRLGHLVVYDSYKVVIVHLS